MGSSGSAKSQSIILSSSSSSTKTPTGTDVETRSHLVRLFSGMDEAAVAGIGSGTGSVAGICWVCSGLRFFIHVGCVSWICGVSE